MVWSCEYNKNNGKILTIHRTNMNNGVMPPNPDSPHTIALISKAPKDFSPTGDTYRLVNNLRVKKVFSNGTVEVEYGEG